MVLFSGIMPPLAIVSLKFKIRVMSGGGANLIHAGNCSNTTNTAAPVSIYFFFASFHSQEQELLYI
jgi:hypothetical protein